MTLKKTDNLIAAVIGKDGRTSAVARALEASGRLAGPVRVLSTGKGRDADAVLGEVLAAVVRERPDFVVIGPEEPLAYGVVDALEERGIACVGPGKDLAMLEASKAFTRDLLTKYGIPGNPKHKVFESIDGVSEFLTQLGDFVVKPDGLTGGKGVKVSGVHLRTIADGLAYCNELFSVPGAKVVIEERLEGEEFSLQSFCDGTHVADCVPVQDHKRAHEGDTGPNTGGMGSYSCADHLLPFLTREDLAAASEINRRVVDALFLETGKHYKGILFGGFMVTKDGVRLLEYNARFGDPEALNVLSLLETDFAEICLAIINGDLDRVRPQFRKAATVCKYIVPQGYPEHPVSGEEIDLSRVPAESPKLKVFNAAVDVDAAGRITLSGSRAIAFVGIGSSTSDAYRTANDAAAAVQGPVFFRRDIGSDELLAKRVRHIDQLRHKIAV